MQEKDFVKIKYSGIMKENNMQLDSADDAPIIVGAKWVIPGVDDALKEMNVGEKKKVEIAPEKGFGPRNPKLIKLVPLAEFKKHGQNPQPGMVINADNMKGRVLSVSGGRVKIDFNHPLAGRTLAAADDPATGWSFVPAVPALSVRSVSALAGIVSGSS